jgi:uncharacterized protein YraI
MTNRQKTPPRGLALPLAAVCLSMGLAFATTEVRAQTEAYTSEPVDLFAGPSDAYPVVTELGPNVPVEVMGCVSDYSWCDVALPGLRGWIYAGYLTYPYQGAYVPLEGYGAVIGLPIVTFSIGAYWGSFYRDRPWYGERDHWAHVPPPGYGGRPQAPPPYHGGPPGGPGHPPPEPPRGAANVPPPQAGRPPINGGAPAGAPRSYAEPPRPPAAMVSPPHAPMPQPNAGRQPGPAPGLTHAPYPAAGGGRPPGPPAGRPEAPPQGGHASGQGGGHDDQRRQY